MLDDEDLDLIGENNPEYERPTTSQVTTEQIRTTQDASLIFD